MSPAVPVALIVDPREDEHVEHQKKTPHSDRNPQGGRVAVVVPRRQSLEQSCFVFDIPVVGVTQQVFF